MHSIIDATVSGSLSSKAHVIFPRESLFFPWMRSDVAKPSWEVPTRRLGLVGLIFVVL